jgi:hypothetical protein
MWNLQETRVGHISLYHAEYQMENGIKIGFHSLKIEESGLFVENDY